jgi:hypothetical protein
LQRERIHIPSNVNAFILATHSSCRETKLETKLGKTIQVRRVVFRNSDHSRFFSCALGMDRSRISARFMHNTALPVTGMHGDNRKTTKKQL